MIWAIYGFFAGGAGEQPGSDLDHGKKGRESQTPLGASPVLIGQQELPPDEFELNRRKLENG